MTTQQKWVLVTGGTGFVGVHTIAALLQQGYQVKTTLRSLSRQQEIIHALQSAGISALDKLVLIEADLNADAGWQEAVKDCAYVLHVASPFPAKEPEDENELIVPAREGALRVLKAARDAGVKRVVLTSSFAAIGYSRERQGHVFTEEDWTNPAAEGVRGYIKSKAIAEKAAWDFIEREGGQLELTVINPTGIFGPAMGGISSASFDVIIKGIVGGAAKESPNFTFGVVDVRDVAQIHLLAMTHPEAKGQRFLASVEGTMSFYDVAALVKKQRPQYAGNIAPMLPTDASFYVHLSNQKATSILGWQPRSREEAILASVDSIYN